MDFGRFLRRLVVQPIGKTTTPRHNERQNDETTKQRSDERGNNKTTTPFSKSFLRPGGMRACALNPHVAVGTERVYVRCGFPVCTCLSVCSLCSPLFALHLVRTLLLAFFSVFFRRKSFEMITPGAGADSAGPGRIRGSLAGRPHDVPRTTILTRFFPHRFLDRFLNRLNRENAIKHNVVHHFHIPTWTKKGIKM